MPPASTAVRKPSSWLAITNYPDTKVSGEFVIPRCSRQESNLERWYRKPAFYPLNYESK
jgi:hypothetical protein